MVLWWNYQIASSASCTIIVVPKTSLNINFLSNKGHLIVVQSSKHTTNWCTICFIICYSFYRLWYTQSFRCIITIQQLSQVLLRLTFLHFGCPTSVWGWKILICMFRLLRRKSSDGPNIFRISQIMEHANKSTNDWITWNLGCLISNISSCTRRVMSTSPRMMQ